MNVTNNLTRLKSVWNNSLTWLLPQVKNLRRYLYYPNGALLFLLFVLFIMFLAALISSNAAEWAAQLFGISKGGSAKRELLTFLGLSMGGVLLALQAFSANVRAKAMEETVKKTEHGQRQERLKNAIEHLGHNSASVRLGGIYELFHLAEDTKEWRQSILDIICAHIRRTTSEKDYQEKYQWEPSEEIQSVLSLFFVQGHTVFQGYQVNLKGGVWLNGADLRGARLQGANLNNVFLRAAHMEDAHMHGAQLHRAQLQCAFLNNARLLGSNLSGSSLQLAHFDDAHMQGAYLVNADLQVAFLPGAKLQGAILAYAHLQDADLRGTHFQGAISQIVSIPFKEHIENRVGKEPDFSQPVFFGGVLSDASIEDLAKGMRDYNAESFKGALRLHLEEVGKKAIRVPPEDSGAITEPPYTQQDAECWIAEYDEAVSVVPRDVKN